MTGSDTGTISEPKWLKQAVSVPAVKGSGTRIETRFTCGGRHDVFYFVPMALEPCFGALFQRYRLWYPGHCVMQEHPQAKSDRELADPPRSLPPILAATKAQRHVRAYGKHYQTRYTMQVSTQKCPSASWAYAPPNPMCALTGGCSCWARASTVFCQIISVASRATAPQFGSDSE